MGNIVIAESWSHLMEVLAGDATQVGLIDRHRSDKVYRGMADSSWALHTSLQRVNKNFDLVEKHLLRNFIKYAPQTSVAFNSFWNWLTLAQHHGLPTRLMDWTYSPLIALHFALDNHTSFKQNGDAAIWSVDLDMIKATLPPVIKKRFDADGAYSFSIDTLDELWGNIDELSEKSEPDFMIFFEPPSFDDRIINQYALLSTTRNSETIVSDWLKNNPNLYRQIIIPKELKWEFRDRLDQINITERIIYPGLDGLCTWLKRWYCSK